MVPFTEDLRFHAWSIQTKLNKAGSCVYTDNYKTIVREKWPEHEAFQNVTPTNHK